MAIFDTYGLEGWVFVIVSVIIGRIFSSFRAWGLFEILLIGGVEVWGEALLCSVGTRAGNSSKLVNLELVPGVGKVEMGIGAGAQMLIA
jgi:hypothetical protein